MTQHTPMPHTPTPWRVHEGPDLEVYHDDGDVCPVIATIDRDNTSEEQALADSRLIVRAVNSHEALVAALKQAKRLLFIASPEDEKIVAQVEAALKLAEES